MGKKKSEKLKENFTKNYIPQLKELFRDWDVKVMSYVMMVVIMVAMIAATVAWFTHMSSALAAGLGFTTGSNESLKVEVKQAKNSEAADRDYFVEVKDGEEDTVLVDLTMPMFDNVETYSVPVNGAQGSTGNLEQTVNKLAPGVYGSVTIRLTALSPEVDHFKITPEVLMTYIDGTSDSVSNEEEASDSTETGETQVEDATESESGDLAGRVSAEVKIQLKNLLKGHIQFFTNRAEITDDSATTVSITTDANTTENLAIAEYVHCDKYVFYNTDTSGKITALPLSETETQSMTGELEWETNATEGTPKEITLYWYWPYEYANLGSKVQGSIQLTGSNRELQKQYFDEERMNENVSWNETQLYDYADTKIGTYVKNMKLHLEVEGYHEEGQAQDTTSP